MKIKNITTVFLSVYTKLLYDVGIPNMNISLNFASK